MPRATARLVPALAALLCVLPAAAKPHKGESKATVAARLRPLIERHLAIAHDLTAGKLAWDAGDYSAAADRFEALLAVKDLPADVAAAVRPLAEEAREKAGGGAAPQVEATAPDTAADAAPDRTTETKTAEPSRKTATFAITGTVSGGGAAGPGGAVVTLHRASGKTPKPSPLTSKRVAQKDKRFVPHVLAVPVGSTVTFRNQDDLFHNVFSISPAHPFDTGLKKAGDTGETFDKPGVIELLCNIHATMNAWLLVVDTPWYAVADGGGAFRIKNVPPGEYDVEVWHENASAPARSRLTLDEDSAPLTLSAGGDRRPNQFPPDKYGKPRQQQLGY